MELKQLINFQTVAKYNNFSQAAKELHLSQPALSQSIHNLEKELGLLLFTRSGRKIALNEAGTQMLVYANHVIDSVNSMYYFADIYKQSHKDRITIIVKAASPILLHIMNEYYKLHPELTINILMHGSSLSYSAPHDIVVDTSIEECFDENGISIIKEELLAVLPPKHRLAHRDYINLDELADESFISLSDSYTYRDILDYWCAQAGFKCNVSFESDDSTAVRNLIQMGGSVAIVPKMSWDFIWDDKIIAKPLKHPECYRYINVHINSNNPSKAVYDLYRYIISYFRAFKTS